METNGLFSMAMSVYQKENPPFPREGAPFAALRRAGERVAVEHAAFRPCVVGGHVHVPRRARA